MDKRSSTNISYIGKRMEISLIDSTLFIINDDYVVFKYNCELRTPMINLKQGFSTLMAYIYMLTNVNTWI